MSEASSEQNDINSRQTLALVLLSIVGAGLGYLLSICAARLMGTEGFEQYVVTIASLGLLMTIAEAGVGKYALKVLPAFAVTKQWASAAGYLRFSLLITLTISLILMGAVLVWLGGTVGNVWQSPLAMAVLFLPALAATGVGVDFLMASRSPLFGAGISRLLVPLSTLVFLLASSYCLAEVTPRVGVICFGFGGLVGVVLCFVGLAKVIPSSVFRTRPEYGGFKWARQCGYFAAISFLSTWILRISVLIMEWLPVEESHVGHFAAALETGCLIMLMTKSTDKLFEPEVSMILEQHNWPYVRRLRETRFTVVATACILFLAVMVLFGKPILRLYGPGYDSGYWALCMISSGCCMWTMFSLASTYLRFVGRLKYVMGVTVAGAVSMAALTWVLGARFGVTGAGAAFGVVITGMTLVFWATAREDLLGHMAYDQIVRHRDDVVDPVE